MAKLEIDAERCKCCGYCLSVCPRSVLETGGVVNSKGYHYIWVKRPEECIGCALCAAMCPEAAIEVYKEE